MISILRAVALALPLAGGEQAAKVKPNPEKSIQAGLAWLARHQSSDGSWGVASLAKRCTASKGCCDPRLDLTDHYDEGLTGLALLCFLRSGFDDQTDKDLADPLTGKPFHPRTTVASGLAWLKKTQTKGGSFGRTMPFVYNDSIGTLAMIEAFAATKNTTWKDCAQRGVEFLLKSQRPNPTDDGPWGWRYLSRST